MPENLGIQVRNSNWSLRTPNKVALEYANLQKQQSFNNRFTSNTQTGYTTNFRTK